jgi:DNA mismatch repair ATPase MutS
MKVFLAYCDRDLDLAAQLPANAETLTQDLGLDILFGAMAAGDRFLPTVAKSTVLASLTDVDAIRYRQAVLADCLAQPAVVRELYALAVEAIEREHRLWWHTARSPDSLLSGSVDRMKLFVELLRRLRVVAEGHASAFHSEGFTRLFGEIARELDDRYLSSVDQHLLRLQFRDGVRVSAELGPANLGINYVLRRRVRRPSLRERIGLAEPESYVWQLPERDDAGAQALGEMRSRGIALAANALGQSTDHILSYFAQLRSELGFYVGCLNLHDALDRMGAPTCLPEPGSVGEPTLRAGGLYDAGLRLSMTGLVVGSDVDADGKVLLVITGANRGGKSTFLRALGLAQLMMQCGMFVPAESFQADVRGGLFTHFKREEDATLRSGKLDEELSRMSLIVDQVRPDSLVLLNESFASTNEREGSEIGRQIVGALLEAGIKVGYVTHMFDLASGFHAVRSNDAVFLRAERLPDGRRTFRLIEGEPLPSSHGQDIYHAIFGDEPADPRSVEGEVAAGGP